MTLGVESGEQTPSTKKRSVIEIMDYLYLAPHSCGQSKPLPDPVNEAPLVFQEKRPARAFDVRPVTP
jgi:hypothetical protein